MSFEKNGIVAFLVFDHFVDQGNQTIEIYLNLLGNSGIFKIFAELFMAAVVDIIQGFGRNIVKGGRQPESEDLEDIFNLAKNPFV